MIRLRAKEMENMQIQHNNEIITIYIIRSRRKTACLRILPDGRAEVRGPKLMSDAFVREFVQAKADWILKKRREAAEYQSKKRIHTYQSGDVFLYLGMEYVLSIKAAGRKRMELAKKEEERLLLLYTVSFETKGIERQIKEWYKKQAEEYITKQVEYYAQMIPGKYESITMENRKGRWGSCSSKGGLTFNWRLMMAPPEIIDYVVVHELCHLEHMDHSPSYWRAVESVLPDYKLRKEWLKENGISLNL